MDLLPAMKAATLAQRAHRVGEGVVDIMEQHLVPAMLATQHQGHDIVQHRPSAAWVLCQEFVPGERVSEVGDEHPGRRETNTSEEGHGKHEPPSLAQWPTQRIRAKEPHASPQAQHEGVVLQAPWNPFVPEVFIAFTTCTLIWEVHPGPSIRAFDEITSLQSLQCGVQLRTQDMPADPKVT